MQAQTLNLSLKTRTPIFPIEIFQWCLWGTVIIRSVIASNGVLQDGIRSGLVLRVVVALVGETEIAQLIGIC